MLVKYFWAAGINEKFIVLLMKCKWAIHNFQGIQENIWWNEQLVYKANEIKKWVFHFI